MKANMTMFKDNTTILFQGDSITHGGRSGDNDWNHLLGHGYAQMLAARLCMDYPERKLNFLNRGVSADRTVELLARWKTDTLQIKPDVLSLLIGVNDVGGEINQRKGGVPVEHFEKQYRRLLNGTLAVCPDVKFVLCSPFVLRIGTSISNSWDRYRSKVDYVIEIVKRLADEYNAIFVPFQDAFDKALDRAPAEYWIWDGIHPMPAGHELMVRTWLDAVERGLK